MKLNLAESLRELMGKQMFEKITIKQICDRAGVIRATFYNYFDDKYDCLNWIVYHDLIEKNYDHFMANQVGDHLKDALKTIEENRSFYRTAYNVIGQNSFEDMIRDNLSQFLSQYFNRYRKPDYLNKYENTLLAGYYAETLAFCVRLFVFEKGGCTSVENTERMIYDLMSHSFYDFIKQGA